MLTLSIEMITASVTNLRRAIGLLDLSCDTDAASRSFLDNARANIAVACDVLTEFPAVPQTAVSVAKLLLKAELALASMDWSRVKLNVSVADCLVLETRVRLESLDPETDSAHFIQTVPMLDLKST